MSPNPSLIVFVYTGDRKYAGTDNSVYLILHGKDGSTSSRISLSHWFRNDFERGQIDTFQLSDDDVAGLDRFVEVDVLEIWKDATLGVVSDDWFVDKIVVENAANHRSYVFPFLRWVKSGRRYLVKHLDTSLPQHDGFKDQRDAELEEKRKVYQYDQKFPNGLVQVKTLPPDENFSFDYKWDLVTAKTFLKAKGKLSLLTTEDFKSLEDIKDLYGDKVFTKPKCADEWECDKVFGRKRMDSINYALIRRFTEIPDKFPVTDQLLGPLLEGRSIQHAIDCQRLYWVDLNILQGIPCKPGHVICCPMLLLYVDEEKNLRPVAIQLFQEPCQENPIFTPLDDPTLWTFVKMWYDNADCCYHQALTHLGLTHLLMEGVCVAAHRTMSPSHPIFKILAPHFLYLLAINSRAVSTLVAPGEWVDKTMAYGSHGLLALAAKGFETWRMNVEGIIPANIKDRGIDNPNTLPNFYWRDDALLLFDAIRKYVGAYIDIYYESSATLAADQEVQAWVKELAMERNGSDGGVGIRGVPGNGCLSKKEDLGDIVASTIYTCSCAHATANFKQYDMYGYPPNYPPMIKAEPPTSKDDKEMTMEELVKEKRKPKDVRLTEEDICSYLPQKEMTQDILTITWILSRKGTNSLGDFEVEYIVDPRAQEIVARFREELDEISKKIKARNEMVEFPYDDLLPENIPNSISI